MKQAGTMDLTQGSVTKKFISFVIPIMLSLLLQQLYNVADRIIVGRFAENGKFALAAVGATSSAIVLFLNLFNGLAIGTNVICANHRGARDEKGLRQCMHSAIVLSVYIGLIICLLGLAVSRPLLQLMDTPEDVLELAIMYMRIYLLGVPASAVYNFGANILRAHGDTKRSMYILSLTGLINVGLNLVFVIGCGMSVAGVAIATTIAQYISMIWMLWILFSPRGIYKMRAKQLKLHRESAMAVVRVGIPCGLNGMVFSVSNMILQSSLNSFGSVAVAGKTAALDISTMVYQGINASQLACVSFSGQCYGAKNYKRIDSLLLRSIGICGAYVAVVAGVCTLFSQQLLGLFNSDPGVISVGTNLLMINVWGYLIYTTSEIATGCSRGMGHSGIPSLLNFLGICVPRLLWVVLIFPLKRDITFLYLCYPISWIISTILQLSYYLYVRKGLDTAK